MTQGELAAKLREALARRADVRFAILFGSCATKGPDQARDVDVAVRLRAPLSLMGLGALELELEDAVGKEVDVVDVDEASTVLRWEILRTGRVVDARDEEALHAFRVYVPLEYADLRPYLDREAAGQRRALGVR